MARALDDDKDVFPCVIETPEAERVGLLRCYGDVVTIQCKDDDELQVLKTDLYRVDFYKTILNSSMEESKMSRILMPQDYKDIVSIHLKYVREEKWTSDVTFEQLTRLAIFCNKIQDLESMKSCIELMTKRVDDRVVRITVSWLIHVGDSFDTTSIRNIVVSLLNKDEDVRLTFFSKAKVNAVTYILPQLKMSVALWGICCWVGSGGYDHDMQVLLRLLPDTGLDDSPLMDEIVEMVTDLDIKELTTFVLRLTSKRFMKPYAVEGISRIVTLEEFDIKHMTFTSPQHRLAPPDQYGERNLYVSCSVLYDGELNWTLELPDGELRFHQKPKKKKVVHQQLPDVSVMSMMMHMSPEYAKMMQQITIPPTLPSEVKEEEEQPENDSVGICITGKEEKRCHEVIGLITEALRNHIEAYANAFNIGQNDPGNVERIKHIIKHSIRPIITKFPTCDVIYVKIRKESRILNFHTREQLQPIAIKKSLKGRRPLVSFYVWGQRHNEISLVRSLRQVEIIT